MSDQRELLVAVGAYDATVTCLSFSTGPEVPHLRKKFRCKGHSGSVRAVTSQGVWLATGSTDESIRLYDLRNCSEIGRLVHHQGSVTWVTFCGDRMFSASEDGSIAVWKTGTWECANTLTGHKGPVRCVAVHQTGKLALSVGRDRVLRTWDLSTGIAVFRQKLKEVAQLVEWSLRATHYALSFRIKLEIYNTQTGDVVSTVSVGNPITSITFVSDEVVAVASDQSVIQLFSVASGESVAELKGHTQRVKGVASFPERNLLFSASSDGSVRAWHLTQPLSESVCVSVFETGSRLNCICIASPPADDGSQKMRTASELSRDRDKETVTSAISAISRSKHTRRRQLRCHANTRRMSTRRNLCQLPFGRRRPTRTRRHRHVAQFTKKSRIAHAKHAAGKIIVSC